MKPSVYRPSTCPACLGAGTVPTPGGRRAVLVGCRCSPDLNRAGAGIATVGGLLWFVRMPGCPVHRTDDWRGSCWQCSGRGVRYVRQGEPDNKPTVMGRG